MESLFSTMIVLFLVSISCLTSSEAIYSNKGNITIKWDLISWTPDGYIAVVTSYNYQKQRSVPGWKMRWTWTKNEVIRNMFGATTTEQGDCSRFKGNIPNSCVRKPTVVDLLPGAPFNQKIANCCKNGVLKPGSQSAFQLSVGSAGNSKKTARMPENVMFKAPKQQYICGPAKNVRPTRYITEDKRRMTTAMMTWKITCLFHKVI